MPAPARHAEPRNDRELYDANRDFYEALWARSRLVRPERFNTWPLVEKLVREVRPEGRRLEIAPGLRPRLPVEHTTFVDLSEAAVTKLRAAGANALVGVVSHLPVEDRRFELVAAFDIVEHVDDDNAALAELTRVAAPGAALLLSAPLHARLWTSFDELVGHRRRYEPDELTGKLGRHGWGVESSAVYGMQPRSSRLLDYGVWQLQHRRDRAIWFYDRFILPMAAFFQKKLELHAGLMDTANVDEILLVCRLAGPRPS